MPQDSFAHADVRALPAHARSTERIGYLGARTLRIPAYVDTTYPLTPVRYGAGFNLADSTTLAPTLRRSRLRWDSPSRARSRGRTSAGRAHQGEGRGLITTPRA
jgi:hypothetical protein